MVALTSSEFLARFPELAQTPPAVIEAALETAGRECSKEVWGTSHTDGVAYYAAHLLALRVRQIGATTGESVKGPGGTSTFQASWYGQQFRDLQRALPLTGFYV